LIFHDIGQRNPVMILIERAGVKPVLPEMPAMPVSGVEILRVPPVRLPDRLRQRPLIRRGECQASGNTRAPPPGTCRYSRRGTPGT